MSDINITLKFFNGELLNYTAKTITDPVDGVGKVKLTDHIDNLRNLILTRLNIDNIDRAIRFIHPNEDEEMLSLYFKKYETDKIFKTKLSLFNLIGINNINNEESFIRKMVNQFDEKDVQNNVPNIEDENILQYLMYDYNLHNTHNEHNNIDDENNSYYDEEADEEADEEEDECKKENKGIINQFSLDNKNKKYDNCDQIMSCIYTFISDFIPNVDIVPEKDDPKEYIKNKLSDKTSPLYFLMYSELLKEKIYTQDITLDVYIDDVLTKDISDASDTLKNINTEKRLCCIM